MGDMVAFANPCNDRLTVHRVVHFSMDGFLIKGDNSPEPDGWIGYDKILGYVTRIERDSRNVQVGLGIERVVIAFLSRIGWLAYFPCSLSVDISNYFLRGLWHESDIHDRNPGFCFVG